MRYKVVKTDIIDPAIDSPEWERANVGYVAANRWKEYSPTPITSFKMLRGPEGISVLMETEEKQLRAEITKENGMVCQDSCMEFFFKPSPWDANYLNFEINPRGVMHLGMGAGRHGRALLDTDRAVFSIVSHPEDGNWQLKFYIPDSFIAEHFERTSNICKGNFYKCGDLTGHEHYGMWSEVETPTPDFHVPDFFGKIEF